jgi:hypothetical protein
MLLLSIGAMACASRSAGCSGSGPIRARNPIASDDILPVEEGRDRIGKRREGLLGSTWSFLRGGSRRRLLDHRPRYARNAARDGPAFFTGMLYS